MKQFQVQAVGFTGMDANGYFIQIDEPYRRALTGLHDFSHAVVLWWLDGFDADQFRSMTVMSKPYNTGPEMLGIFATRSPIRPNPIAVSTVSMLHVDEKSGRIDIAYLDAHPNSPVLDIKPYTPSVDRVADARVPSWCAHWPKSYEESGDFDWEQELSES